MKKVFLALILMVGFGMVLHAGGGRDDTVTPIRWGFWGSVHRVDLTNQTVRVFEDRYSDIRIFIEPTAGTGDLFDRFNIQQVAGASSDIIQLGGNFPDFARTGAIIPLDDFIRRGVIDGTQLAPGDLDTGRYQGQLFGITTGTAKPALVYNRDLLQRHGLPLPSAQNFRTYAEFLAYLQVLRAGLPAGVYPMTDFGFTSQGSMGFGYWAGYMGHTIFNAANRTTTITPAVATEFFTLWQTYRTQGLIPPAVVTAEFPETSAANSAIVAGRVAIGFIVSTQLPAWQAAMTDRLGLAPPPGAHVGRGAGTPLWPQPSQFMSISRDARNPDAAARVINFMINDPEAGRIMGNDRGAPASASFRSGMQAADPVVGIINNYHDLVAQFTGPMGDHVPHDTEWNASGFLIHQQVAFGNLTPAQGGQQLYDLLRRLMAQ